VLPSGDETSLIEAREEQLRHLSYHSELLLMSYMRDGNVAMVEYLLQKTAEGGITLKKLSDNELRQAQYYAVILTYQASRVAIQAGMFEAKALKRADDSIRKIDRATSAQEVMTWIGEAFLEWTKAIAELKALKDISPPIRACLEYLYEHLTSPITLDDLAKVSGYTPPHLSAQFKKEVGENFSKYLMRLRIKTAQTMLSDTTYSAKEIGYHLNFSSESHFIRCFKEVTGVTPKEFRRRGII
jgi:YesN/AraC family two-component response regulator